MLFAHGSINITVANLAPFSREPIGERARVFPQRSSRTMAGARLLTPALIIHTEPTDAKEWARLIEQAGPAHRSDGVSRGEWESKPQPQ